MNDEKSFYSAVELFPEIIFLSNATGENYYLNKKWYEYTGNPKGELSMDAWTRVIPSEDLVAISESWSKARAEKKIWIQEYRIRGSDGVYRWHLGRSVPELNENGEIIRWLGSAINIHDKKVEQENLRKSEARLRQYVTERESYRNLYKQTPEIVCILTGPNHVYEFVNEAYIRTVGTDATGKTVREILPEELKVHQILDDVYRTGKTAEFHEVPVAIKNKVHYFNLTYAPYTNARDEVTGIMIIGTEITNQVMHRLALDAQKKSLELALQGAPLKKILEILISMVETQSADEVMGSILLMDPTGKRLFLGAAPHLTEGYNNAIDGIEIGKGMGSCGSAAYLAKTIVVTDIENDPLWKNYKDIALQYGLRSCWSTPIFSSRGKVLGTFAIYSKKVGHPLFGNMQLIDLITRTVALVIERKFSQEELEKAKAEAESASATKSAFLANMSHEIRTPLGAIMGFVDLMKQTNLNRRDLENYLSVISRNSDQLLRIIDDILDLSKVEAGKMLIENIEFSLTEMLSDFYSLMGFRAKENAITFELKAETPLPAFIRSDPTRLRQILTNLVGNAIKFTEKGKVELSVIYRAPYIEFLVKDTGCGITPEQAKNLFQPFTQADISTTRKFGGTGLGLVLTKKLSEALGGDAILVESKLGVGSTFKTIVKIAVAEKTEIIDKSKINFSSKNAVTSAKISPVLEGLKVLVVEDSPDNQLLIQIFLTQAGAQVEIANDGREGCDMAMNDNFDLILMDVQMPRMDGHEATRKLREYGYKKPIIALTAHAMKEERQRTVDSGFSGFLPKPLQRDQLIEMIQNYKGIK